MIVSNADILPRVIALVASKANLQPAEVKPETHFINDLNFDSLELVELTMSVEDTFDLTIAEEEVQKLMTVQLLADAIVEHTNRASVSD